MRIRYQKVRQQYWPHDARSVGEGRTAKEAIGDLIMRASFHQLMYGSPVVHREPDGPLSHMKPGL